MQKLKTKLKRTFLQATLVLLTFGNPISTLFVNAYAKGIDQIQHSIVKLEGPTSGTGVIISSRPEHCILITAKHVVEDLREGEEMSIILTSGREATFKKSSISLMPNIDIAIIRAKALVECLPIDISKSTNNPKIGEKVLVAGYPLPSTAVPYRTLRAKEGIIEGIIPVPVEGGYNLLYSSATLPGMSGGAVLNDSGELIGIHGQGETTASPTEMKDIWVKTGTNQGIPISSFMNTNSAKSSDLIAKAKSSIKEAKYYAPINSQASIATAASQKEMNLYTRIAALNSCIYRSSGVEFDKAVGIAGETMAQLIQGQHGGRIHNIGNTPLALEDLRKGSINSVVLGAAELCPQSMPQAVLNNAKKAMSK